MNSSKSSPRRGGKSSYKFKTVLPFDMFYQLTYMSAMSSAGITRSKTFEIAAQASSPVAQYFKAINTLVDEFRYDYPEACRAIGEKTKQDEVRSFLLRLSDALRSGEPLAEFLAREASVQGEHYANAYERDLESLKQWSDAFSSIVVSVALIVIIQLVSSMIYSMKMGMMAGLVTTGVVMGFFGAWIISRAAPQETLAVALNTGSAEQRQAFNIFKITLPIVIVLGAVLGVMHVKIGWVLIWISLLILPMGIVSLLSDRKTFKKEEEFATFLRSAGGMASSTGTTLKQALTKIDLSSFPVLEPDITRLSTRLEALVDPTICWEKFGSETGSQLINDTVQIFYGAVKLGGDPERVGYLCSLFASRTVQLRAKRRLVASTFSGLTMVMHGVVAALMVFVMEVIYNFINMVESVVSAQDAERASETLSMGMASFTPAQLDFLTTMTIAMVILLALISAVAILGSDGGYKFKAAFYLSIALLISGVSFLIVPPLVVSILQA